MRAQPGPLRAVTTWKLWRCLFALCLAVGLVLAPVQAGREGWGPQTASAGFFNTELELFEEVLDLVTEKYVYPPDYRKIFAGAIDQMLETVPAEGLILRDHGSGKTLKSHDHKLTYYLNYSRKDNLNATRNVYRFLLRHLPAKVKETDLERAAIFGLMDSLDEYSLYMDPEEFENSMRDTEGQYGGLGMVITMEDYQLTVVKTMKNSPAARAGLQKGDIITHVDGEPVKGLHIQELARRLRGYPNTQVRIQIHRPKTGSDLHFVMTREIISIETVQWRWLPERTAYIKISSFSKQTNEQLEEVLTEARKKKVGAFILDLRDNPGGLLKQSVLVASHFLAPGKRVVYTRGRHRRDTQEYEALFEDSFHRLPVAVLLNHHSASAAEIVAGSLRDSGKAILIGENSYGKGSVQTIFRMSDGSGLRLTTSKYYTPSGTDISEHGIEPEIHIERDLVPAPPEARETGSRKGRTPSPKKQLVVKESELTQYLKARGIEPSEDLDPLAHFARIVLKGSRTATRSHALARARELVREMHY